MTENVTPAVTNAGPKPAGPRMDIKTKRDRWGFGEGNKHGRLMFILGTQGAAIGLGNMWKFPNLTLKHGGVAFIVAYVIVLILAGLPMLILEFTLGQKMQRGSAGALRGIIPRLAGVGWVASFSGFVVCLIYNMLLALTVYYMGISGSMPWTLENWRGGADKQPAACKEGDELSATSAELYLYMDVVGVKDEGTCDVFTDGTTEPKFNGSLLVPMIIMWVVCGIMLVKGVKSYQWFTAVLVPLTFILLIVLIIQYMGLNNSNEGKGLAFYLGG